MAYIRKYREGWRAEVQRHGHRATHLAKTKRDASAWAMKKEAELDAKAGARGETFGQAVDRYLETVTPTKPGSKAASYERHRFDAMLEHFGEHTPLATIDSDRIGKWRDWRLQGDEDHQKVSGSTVRREANLLRNLFSVAVDEWKWIERNPFKGVRLPKHNAPRHAIWGWRDILTVLRAPASGKTLQTIHAFRIALHTGMRLNEVLVAKLDGRVAVLPKDKSTQNQPVKVPLTRRGARLLAQYGGKFTMDPNEASALFSRLLDDLGIEGLTFHDSRATALTLLSRKVDVLTLARISRHRDLKILQNSYYRETPEQIAARL